jgi:exonuclease SbcC
MAIKINRILINNFKPFRKFEINFTDSRFIVFDGPNGFGKTSFYDAIELLLTGRMRRYDELYETTIHGKKILMVAHS